MIKCQAKDNTEIIYDYFGAKGGSVYISHHGYVTPCCWIGTLHSLKTLWKESGLDPKLHNINHYSIQEIIDGPIFKWIEDQWTSTNFTETLRTCKNKCEIGKYDKVKSTIYLWQTPTDAEKVELAQQKIDTKNTDA